jgi:hypothetical protein
MPSHLYWLELGDSDGERFRRTTELRSLFKAIEDGEDELNLYAGLRVTVLCILSDAEPWTEQQKCLEEEVDSLKFLQSITCTACLFILFPSGSTIKHSLPLQPESTRRWSKSSTV